MGKSNETETGRDNSTAPWKTPGQSAQDPKNHPPPPESRKEREDRHNETA
jgi:hypothetical protein